ncbi:TetR/AcrR family transcriptional regulator [Gaiella sp.]|uniref:TetR/AcrR family transcriptional regulator n=1 Tax=Gaiella sp. TaxID=2663207 RepID=UPI002E30E1A5|nr:TetR/AcrR family transcriptional regulator [Gaiella sp.]HEX5582823.1 TetR/AcrR family transcriptional regulator [Gaiella sp.]
MMTDGAPETRETAEAPGPDGQDDDQWPFYRYPRPRPGRASREEAHERRIAGHVQKHRDRGAQPPRRDRGLSRDEIVKAAIAVADAEGPEAISMRRIAREVGAGVMSLYWYVSSKEELLDLMLNAIEAEIEVPDPSGDWRADLGVFAHRTRESLRRHRWAVDFIGSRPPSTPNDVRNLERLLALLDGLGVEDVRLIFGVFMTVATFVIGAVIREAQEVHFQREQERVEASLTPEEVQAEHERYRAWFESAGEFPHIAKLMKSGVDPDDPDTREERFQFSLDCVLDGIAAKLAASGARTAR